ncbi:MAG: PrsW family intramembrane metalloprotease [Pseudobutyrivibrio sp.]|nr:PrsW family intramembrane metalloprotease [Pseudobutyrivibrio sp.]
MTASILLAVAIIPTLAVLFYVYKLDKVEPEPFRLLAKTFLFGVISTVPAIVIEFLGDFICEGLSSSMIDYLVLEYLLLVPITEEFCKRFFVKLAVWESKEFDYTFDAIVYCVFGSMGFACLENILYVYQYGLSTGLLRAVTSIPGHAIFGLYMGIFLGKAKVAYADGDLKHYKYNYTKSLFIPVLLHGLYDYIVSLAGEAESIIIYAVWIFYIIMMDVWAFREIKEASETDHAIKVLTGDDDTPDNNANVTVGNVAIDNPYAPKTVSNAPVYTTESDSTAAATTVLEPETSNTEINVDDLLPE